MVYYNSRLTCFYKQTRCIMNNLLNNKYFIYFLGYFWADGYVCKNKYVLQLSIQRTDADNIYPILSKFNDKLNRPITMKYDKPPKNKNWSQMARFYTSDHKLYHLLKETDFCQKSSVMPYKILSKIPEKLHHYFYLGLIDGDGCFSISKNRLYHFSISGPFNYNWEFIEEIFKNKGIKYTIGRFKRNKGANSAILVYGMYNVSLIGDFIYQDDEEFSLKRKRKLYNEIKIRSLIPASKHKRVFFCKTSNKFSSYLKLNKKIINLGKYDSEEEAIKAKDIGDKILNLLQSQIIS